MQVLPTRIPPGNSPRSMSHYPYTASIAARFTEGKRWVWRFRISSVVYPTNTSMIRWSIPLKGQLLTKLCRNTCQRLFSTGCAAWPREPDRQSPRPRAPCSTPQYRTTCRRPNARRIKRREIPATSFNTAPRSLPDRRPPAALRVFSCATPSRRTFLPPRSQPIFGRRRLEVTVKGNVSSFRCPSGKKSVIQNLI